MNKCCICGKSFDGFGNNPDGAKWIENGEVINGWFNHDDICCDECNNRYVIPGRMYSVFHQRIELSEKEGTK